MDSYLKGREWGKILHCEKCVFGIWFVIAEDVHYINIISEPAGSLESPGSNRSMLPLVEIAYIGTSAK